MYVVITYNIILYYIKYLIGDIKGVSPYHRDLQTAKS